MRIALGVSVAVLFALGIVDGRAEQGANQPAPGLDTARIEKLTGAKGSLDPQQGVFKVSVPRTDLSVTAAGVRMTPAMGLTSWAAFKRVDDHSVVMGDLVLLEDQVNPVMSAALDQGLEVTALHNHFFWDTPKVMFMHIAGSGDEAALATSVGRVFAKITETAGGKGDVPHAGIDPARTSIDPVRLEAVLGSKGTLSGGVYKVVIGRATRMHGHEMGSAMGVNTWAAFAGSDERAVVDGDFAMLESELQGVLKALRKAGIFVVAIHNHMAGEDPRIVFLHYWGVGRSQDLARGLRSALDQTGHDRRASMETVIFVCEHGNVKSVMAAEWFNRMARERGLSVHAEARGLRPETSMPPAIVERLRGDGFDVGGRVPRALTRDDLSGVLRVVSIGVDTTAVTGSGAVPVERWDGVPPATEDYESSRDALRARIETMLRTLRQ